MPFGDREMRVPTFCVDPEEHPVVFLVVKQGAVGLASVDYVAEELHSVREGDLALKDAWDRLLIKTPEMTHPQPCELLADTLDMVAFLVDGETVFRMEV